MLPRRTWIWQRNSQPTPLANRGGSISNLEFLREGAAISDFKRPDHILIGIDNKGEKKSCAAVYRPLYRNESLTLFVNRRTSELIKYAANAFLATKITFINEIADLCEAVGANVQDVSRGIGLDNHIGKKFLHADPGYGGSCFPKDTRLEILGGLEQRQPVHIVEAVVKENDARKHKIGRKVLAALGDSPKGKTVALLGLTFKPNTDNMRDAPAIAIAQALTDEGVSVRAYDPEGMAPAREMMPDLTSCGNANDAAEGADAVVIVTEWDAFRARSRQAQADHGRAVLVDLRNVYRRDEVEGAGFSYTAVGR